MPSYSNLTPRQLRAKLALVERDIGEKVPDLINERNLILDLLRKAEVTAATEFREVKGWAAIAGALRKLGKPSTVREVQDTLIRGGFPNEKRRMDTVRDLLNRHWKVQGKPEKRLTCKDGLFWFESS